TVPTASDGFGIAQIRYALPQTDLAITKVGPATVTAGTQITYTLNVVNNGPLDAQGVVVTDAAPPGTSILAITTPASWNPTSSTTAQPTTPKSTVAAGETASFTIAAQVSASDTSGSTIANPATITTTTPDSNPSNNNASFFSTVNTSADLAV